MHRSFEIRKIQSDIKQLSTTIADCVAIEEPLEIRLAAPFNKTLSITMRTPGKDAELALGFLWTEGIIKSISELKSIDSCGADQGGYQNIVKIKFKDDFKYDLAELERHFYTSSSCGICGKTSIEALKTSNDLKNRIQAFEVSSTILFSLPEKLKAHQRGYDLTGGIHGCALFDKIGNFLISREDVGRHNALDKLIGASLREFEFPLNDKILLLSGRASFELIQKASMAGIGVVAAIGAPSSLAIELAKELHMNLIGFLNNNHMNHYC